MSRLTINAKLALPSLALIAKQVYLNTPPNEQLFVLHGAKLLEVFTRFNISTENTKAVLEQCINNEYISEDLVAAFTKDINAFLTLLKADSDSHQTLLDLFSYVKGSLKGTDSKFVALRNKISYLKNSDLNAEFPLAFIVDQSPYLAIIEKYRDVVLSELRENNPEEYKILQNAKKQTKDIFLNFVRNYVRNIGSLVNYDTMLSVLQQHNIVNTLPQEFKGYIDEHCNLYTLGRLKLYSVPHNCEVIMNPSYNIKTDNAYVCSAKSALAKNYTLIYTEQYKNAARDKKFTAVKNLKKSIKDLRAGWVKHLIPTSKYFEEAIILELIYTTQARIGNKNNATVDKRSGKARQTYGISTILNEHFSIEDGILHIKYPGKAAFKGDHIHYQEHKVEPINKELELIINWFAVNNRPKVFSTTDAKTRAFFKSLNPPEYVTIHKLRTLQGTLMMQERIKHHPFTGAKNSTAKVTKWLKDEALDVGKQLGHMSGEKYTAATAIAHYIDPATMMRIYREAGVLPTKTMLKLVGADMESLTL